LGLLANEVVFLAIVHSSCCFEIIKLWSSKVQMGRRDEHPILLVEDIDHKIHNVVFKSLVLSMVIHQLHQLLNPWLRFLFSCMCHWYYGYHHNHCQNHKGLEQNTCWVDFLKSMTKNYWVVKVKTNYGKGNSKWTIELCIATKMRTITTFVHCVKLSFGLKIQFVILFNTCCNILIWQSLLLLS
jgi:hypothetical protein